MDKWLMIAAVALAACNRGPEPSAATNGPPSSTAAPASPTTSAVIGAEGPIELPAQWKACSVNRDCVIAAYGCCSKVATSRSYAEATRAALRASGRRYCPVKAACGNGSGGTADGEPAECNRGRCVLPVVLPDYAKACKTEDDCVVAAIDCCNRVAVYKTYEEMAQREMLDLQPDRPSCPPSAACPPPPATCVAGTCQIDQFSPTIPAQ